VILKEKILDIAAIVAGLARSDLPTRQICPGMVTGA
jgi:hypothetical protein